MIIQKKWNIDAETLKRERQPSDWFETTEEECLRHTEEAGYWQEDTVLDMLKNGVEVFTPLAIYRAEPISLLRDELQEVGE